MADQLVNLTPHAVNILDSKGEKSLLSIPPSGLVARLVTEHKISGDVSYQDANEGLVRIEICKVAFSRIELVSLSSDEVTVLPEPQEKVFYIVSMPVAQAVPDRKDVFAPDTSRAKRDGKGMIIGVPGFARY